MSVFSQHWYRVETLKPKLRAHVQFHRHRYRGQRWYILQDPASGRSHRFNEAARFLISLMDGQRSVSEIWEAAFSELGDDAPSQDELIALLSQLHAADLLQCDIQTDSAELFARFTSSQHKGRFAQLLQPTFSRFPLWDPDAWLERQVPRFDWLFHRGMLVLWVLFIAYAALVAGANWAALTRPGLAAVFDPSNWLTLVAAYLFVKSLHELGHAAAIRAFGGEVHEVGIAFLVFMPVPFVDASSSASFGDKWKRIAVSSMGVMVELFLSAAALLLWLEVSPGLLRNFLWNVIWIGGVSTLLLNGNPLLRFDGYYVLADWIEIPNLAGRAGRAVSALFQEYVLGLPERRQQVLAPGEHAWLIGYGITSWCYRTSVSISIAFYLAENFFVAGALLAIWSVALHFCMPIVGVIQQVQADPRTRSRRPRIALVTGALLSAFALGVFVLPIPAWTVSEGVVWLPERAQVRAATDGFVHRVLTVSGSPVVPGQPLIETADPLRAAEIRVLEAKLGELEATRSRQRVVSFAEAEILDDRIAAVRNELATARRNDDKGILRSEDRGHFVVARNDLPGRFMQRGAIVGYVANLEAPTVRTIVRQADIDWVRHRTRSVEVRLAERPGVSIPARVERIEPSASDHLPTLALGAKGGGALAVDLRDPEGLTTAEPFFQLDLALPGNTPVTGIGGRVFVRFDHHGEPLFGRVSAAVRRLFMDELGV